MNLGRLFVPTGRIYELTQEGLLVKSRMKGELWEEIIPFDQIGFQETRFSNHSVGALFLAIVFLIVSIFVGALYAGGGDAEPSAWIVWLVVAVIFSVFYLRSRTQGVRYISKLGTVSLVGPETLLDSIRSQLVARKLASIEERIVRRLEVLDPSEVARYLLGLREALILSEDDFQALCRKHQLLQQSAKPVKELPFGLN